MKYNIKNNKIVRTTGFIEIDICKNTNSSFHSHIVIQGIEVYDEGNVLNKVLKDVAEYINQINSSGVFYVYEYTINLELFKGVELEGDFYINAIINDDGTYTEKRINGLEDRSYSNDEIKNFTKQEYIQFVLRGGNKE